MRKKHILHKEQTYFITRKKHVMKNINTYIYHEKFNQSN